MASLALKSALLLTEMDERQALNDAWGPCHQTCVCDKSDLIKPVAQNFDDILGLSVP